jgi:hypothetical protein
VRQRSIQESMIAPLAAALVRDHGLSIVPGARVNEVRLGARGDGGQARVSGLSYVDAGGAERELAGLDACVLALGSKGMRAVVSGSADLARECPELSRAAALGAIDVVSVRLWLDRRVVLDKPANVFSRMPGLRGAGCSFFMLDALQPDERHLWGGADPQGSVLACDLYNAGALAPLSDDDIVGLLLDELLPCASAAFAGARAVDAHVARLAQAVSWFSPGSFRARPPLETSVPNLVCAGDWVRMGAREHGAKGLCQERAFVSGIEAANALARAGALGPARRRQHRVLPVRPDESQLEAARAANRALMGALAPFGLASPWVR